MRIYTFKTLMKPLMFCGVALSGLSACTTVPSHFGPSELRNKITVAESVERMELYMQPNGLNLSARDRDAMGNFIAEYARFGEGPLYLNIPGISANGIGARQAQDIISQHLIGMGLGQGVMQMGQYEAAPNTPAPVVVSYRRLSTVPMDCQMGASLTHTGDNQPYGGFGCMQSANLAALIDNPRQFLTPYDMAPISGGRRAVVLGKYVKGSKTATPRPSGQEISASE